MSSKAFTAEVKGNRLEMTPDYVPGRMADDSRFAAGLGG